MVAVKFEWSAIACGDILKMHWNIKWFSFITIDHIFIHINKSEIKFYENHQAKHHIH